MAADALHLGEGVRRGRLRTDGIGSNGDVQGNGAVGPVCAVCGCAVGERKVGLACGRGTPGKAAGALIAHAATEDSLRGIALKAELTHLE